MLAGNLTGSFCIFHVIRFSERRRKDSAYDPQEDRDSHSGSARRARTYIDEGQRVHLHAYLLVRGKPDAKQREVLARDTGLDTETIYNWSVRLDLLLLQYSIGRSLVHRFQQHGSPGYQHKMRKTAKEEDTLPYEQIMRF